MLDQGVRLEVQDAPGHFLPKAAGNGFFDFLQPFLVKADDYNVREPGFQAFGDIPDLMVDGGREGDLTGERLGAALQK